MNLSLKIEEIPGDSQAGLNRINQIVSLNLRKIIINLEREQIRTSDYLEASICYKLEPATGVDLSMETLGKINSAREFIYETLGQLDDLKAGEKSFVQIKQDLLSQVQVLEELEYYSENNRVNWGESLF